MKPVVIDLCCGLGGWTQGFLAEGWDAIGFDIEKHQYGDKRYPGQLILKSILDLNGYDLRAVNPALVVASPPCQNYSYMAMPWTRAKEMAARIRADEAEQVKLNALFNACFRIAREIGCPIVLENVKGAQPWVGRARAHFGSYYLWGDVADVGGRVVRADVPARFGEYVRPGGRSQKFNPDGTEHPQGSWFAIADSKERGAQKREGRNFHAFENGLGSSPSFNGVEHETRHVKVAGISFNGGHAPGFNVTAAQRYRAETEGVKQGGSGSVWFDDAVDERRRQASAAIKGTGGGWYGDYAEQKASGRGCSSRQTSSHSDSRKAASAMIAEIPFALAQYIARAFKPA